MTLESVFIAFGVPLVSALISFGMAKKTLDSFGDRIKTLEDNSETNSLRIVTLEAQNKNLKESLDEFKAILATLVKKMDKVELNNESRLVRIETLLNVLLNNK